MKFKIQDATPFLYAIITTGGKQYQVSKGERILVDKLESPVGKEVVLDKVLLIKHDGKIAIGTPTVSGAKVITSVVRQTRSKKIRVFKKKPKKGYRRTIGHRQYLTELKIEEISYVPKK